MNRYTYTLNIHFLYIFVRTNENDLSTLFCKKFNFFENIFRQVVKNRNNIYTLKLHTNGKISVGKVTHYFVVKGQFVIQRK